MELACRVYTLCMRTCLEGDSAAFYIPIEKYSTFYISLVCQWRRRERFRTNSTLYERVSIRWHKIVTLAMVEEVSHRNILYPIIGFAVPVFFPPSSQKERELESSLRSLYSTGASIFIEDRETLIPRRISH